MGTPMPEAEVPDIYCDGMQLGLSPFTAILSLTTQPAGQGGVKAPMPVANIRMSLEHAKIMAIILRKQLKHWETQMGVEIAIPQEVYRQLSLSKQEDW